LRVKRYEKKWKIPENLSFLKMFRRSSSCSLSAENKLHTAREQNIIVISLLAQRTVSKQDKSIEMKTKKKVNEIVTKINTQKMQNPQKFSLLAF
jgi:hypothetical protein